MRRIEAVQWIEIGKGSATDDYTLFVTILIQLFVLILVQLFVNARQ